MSEKTHPTLDWRYLPELPPEPSDYPYSHYLMATAHGVYGGRYRGKGKWMWDNFRDSDQSRDEVYAWAVWPDAPQVKGKPQ